MSLDLDKRQTFKTNFKNRCFKFSISILRVGDELKVKRINWILIDQLVRSATSVGANVVEGGNSSSKKEFINYFQISLKSASETIYWLEMLRELNKSKEDKINELLVECIEIKKLLSTIILNTKSNSKF